ncbi:MAG: hypothetical protein ABSG78_03450 [Verrucomicrobiota bacterium]|jgi:hypothetical protein
MKSNHDPEIDGLYIRFVEGKHERRTVRLNETWRSTSAKASNWWASRYWTPRVNHECSHPDE